jgi:hypothetical protein
MRHRSRGLVHGVTILDASARTIAPTAYPNT